MTDPLDRVEGETDDIDPPLPPEPLIRPEDLGLAELLRRAGNSTPHAGASPSVREMPTPSVPPGYEVLEELGRGGMAVVFKARQTALKRVVALKMIHTGPNPDDQLLGRLRAEAEVIAALQHPHIVQVFDVLEHQGQPVLALEYMPGGNLEQRLAGKPIPAPAATELVETLARAVQACHERGVIHRDLKPANVLLTADGTPKVSDFGLAKKLDAGAGRTQTGQILGTPSYMAPEQTTGGAGEVGPAADVYALGAILYEVITGRPPFCGAGLLATLEQVRSLDPVPPGRLQPGLPRDLETICLKCLAKEPSRRYATAAALAEDLARFRQGQPVRARPIGSLERLLKWARRKPAWAALVLVSVLGLAVLLVGGALYQRRLGLALNDARNQRARAAANYRQARETIDHMLERLKDRAHGGVPRLKEIQRELAEEALTFFEGVAAQEDPDPEVRFDVARVCVAAGDLQHLLGRREQAGESYRRALEVYSALAAQFPDVPRYRAGRAECLRYLGGVGDLRLMDEALTLLEDLIRDDPETERYHALLAHIYNRKGQDAHDHGHRDEAEKFMRRTLESWQAADRLRPGSHSTRYGLARTQLNLSVVIQSDPARHPEARQFHDQAEATLEGMLREDPNDYSALTSLAYLRGSWAYVLADQGKEEEALADLARSVPALEELLRQEPGYFEGRDALFKVQGIRAHILNKLHRFREEAEARRQNVALAEPKEINVARGLLALALVQAGDHREATDEAASLASSLPTETPSNFWHHLGLVYCQALEALGQDHQVTPSERARLRNLYAGRAVELLGKAKKRADAKVWRDTALQLRMSEDWKPLREAVDLGPLLQDAETKK